MESSQMSENEVRVHPEMENNKPVTQTQSESQCECETHEIQSQMYSTLRVGKKLPSSASRAGKNCICSAAHKEEEGGGEREEQEQEQEQHRSNYPRAHSHVMRWWRILQ